MSPDELDALSDVLVRKLTEALDHEVGQVMKARNLSSEDIARQTEAMNENRTEYKRKARPRKA